MRMVLGGALAAILVLAAAPGSADDLVKKAQENFQPIPSVVPAVKDDTVEVVVAGEKDEVVDGLGRHDRVQRDPERPFRGDHLGRVALVRVDAHRRRAIELLLLGARAVDSGTGT